MVCVCVGVFLFMSVWVWVDMWTSIVCLQGLIGETPLYQICGRVGVFEWVTERGWVCCVCLRVCGIVCGCVCMWVWVWVWLCFGHESVLRRDGLHSVTWLVHMDMTHPFVTWLIHVWHDSFTRRYLSRCWGVWLCGCVGEYVGCSSISTYWYSGVLWLIHMWHDSLCVERFVCLKTQRFTWHDKTCFYVIWRMHAFIRDMTHSYGQEKGGAMLEQQQTYNRKYTYLCVCTYVYIYVLPWSNNIRIRANTHVYVHVSVYICAMLEQQHTYNNKHKHFMYMYLYIYMCYLGATPNITQQICMFTYTCLYMYVICWSKNKHLTANMSIYVHVSVYIHVLRGSNNKYITASTHIYIYVSVHIYISMYIYVYTYIHTYIYIYIYIHIYICIHTCKCIYIYVYIHTNKTKKGGAIFQQQQIEHLLDCQRIVGKIRRTAHCSIWRGVVQGFFFFCFSFGAKICDYTLFCTAQCETWYLV